MKGIKCIRCGVDDASLFGVSTPDTPIKIHRVEVGGREIRTRMGWVHFCQKCADEWAKENDAKWDVITPRL